jgi:hypothetical protein
MSGVKRRDTQYYTKITEKALFYCIRRIFYKNERIGGYICLANIGIK